ncbi:MAG TPA: helicase C-terminal domain-containing protein [Thermoproteota archaeon]|nr:helicase C-terminal domain-containing protein [Thermoproteota archaeon]
MDDAELGKFFPYDTSRPGQIEVANRVYSTLVQGGHLIVQAPTGFGKTASLLAASLLAIENERIAVYYIVRTHREAEVVMRELRTIAARRPFPFVAVEMRGRAHLCALGHMVGIDSEVASRLCRAMIVNGGCDFSRGTGKKTASRGSAAGAGIWDSAWAIKTGREKHTCPYLMLKNRALSADIVVSPYQYIIFEPLRRQIMRDGGRSRALVVDECVVEGTSIRTPGGDIDAEDVREGNVLTSVFVEPRRRPRVTHSSVLLKKFYTANTLIEIRTESGNVVEVTANTKLFVMRRGSCSWLSAHDLQRGNLILSGEGVETDFVEVRRATKRRWKRVYDFLVVPDHNYVANGLVVHNSHNLPALSASLSSRRLKIIDIQESLLEAIFLRSPLCRFVERFLRALRETRTTVPVTVETRWFSDRIREASGGVDPIVAIESIRALSERAQGKIISQGGLQESALVRFHSFLRGTTQASPDSLLQYVPRDRFSDDYLEMSWWDTGFGRRMFRGFRSTIHASGTNDWPDAYATLVNLPGRYEVVEASFPLRPEYCFVGVLKNVTTQEKSRTEDNYRDYSEALADLVNSLRGKTALFATSFEVLSELAAVGLRSMLTAKSYWESRDIDSYRHEMMLEGFSGEKNPAVLVGVIGGRSGEGVDFGPGVLNNSIVFGVPFPEPNPLMRRYAKWLDGRSHGKGSEYAYIYPAVVRAAQALGRAPRSPQDRVVCILADKRFSEDRLLGRFPSWIRNNYRGAYDNQDDLVREVERFYSDGLSHE